MEHITMENLLESLEHMRANDRIQVEVDMGKSPDTDDMRKKSYTITKKQFEGKPVFVIICDDECEVVRMESEVDTFIKRDIRKGTKPSDEERRRNDAASIVRELLGADGPEWGTLEDRIVDYLLTTHLRNFSDFAQEVAITPRAIRTMHGVHSDTTSAMVGKAIENLMNEEIITVGIKEEGGYVVQWHPFFQRQLKEVRDARLEEDEG